jgi:hypothetical protein
MLLCSRHSGTISFSGLDAKAAPLRKNVNEQHRRGQPPAGFSVDAIAAA